MKRMLIIVAYHGNDKRLVDTAIREKLTKEIIGHAQWCISVADSGGYSVATENYCWGSNSQVLGSGMKLMMAYELTADRKYYNYASEQSAYLLGKNPMDICYVTVYGTSFPCNPHHRPSIVKGTAVRGMVVGGANMNMEDEQARRLFRNTYPALCYIDDHNSYSTNEVDTYWNTLAVMLLAFIIKNKPKE